jgi:hypothetical protein
MLTVLVYHSSPFVHVAKSFQIAESRLDMIALRSTVRAHRKIHYVEILRDGRRVEVVS